MRLTDDRYADERRRLEVALRMVQFEARTYTIRVCTGLSEDRVRKLFRFYVEGRGSVIIKRRRGKSPRQIQNLLRNKEVQTQASLLAGTFATLGLLNKAGHEPKAKVCIRTSEQLCDAYDVYRQLLTDNPLSFEHSWLLWLTLKNSDELQLRACHICTGLVLHDRYAIRTRACPWCDSKDGI